MGVENLVIGGVCVALGGGLYRLAARATTTGKLLRRDSSMAPRYWDREKDRAEFNARIRILRGLGLLVGALGLGLIYAGIFKTGR
ncbi:MAG: hypothetical protein IPP68_02865 [Elusimicrobia bacterium]|nr:hypothetical protein [Elusimicrobiota bacterium]